MAPLSDRRRALLACLGLTLYWLVSAAPAVNSGFALDDLMNLHVYWERGIAGTLLDNLRFWSTAYRPMGGLYYLPVYRAFGLDPWPYHVVTAALVLANTLLAFLFTRRISGSLAAGVTAGGIACAHAGMTDVYLVTSGIYDVAVVFWGLLLLLAYVSWRDDLTLLRTAALCGLLAAAFNSKEIAIVLPAAIAAYEVLVHGLRPDRRLALLGVLAALSGAYLAGKLTGPESLKHVEAYRMAFSLDRYSGNNAFYLKEILYYATPVNGAWSLAAFWGVIAALGAWSRRGMLQWACVFAAIVTLPISFIPRRGGASLYLPLVAWAILLALAAAETGRRWTLRSGRPWTVFAAAFVCGFFIFAARDNWSLRARMLREGQAPLRAVLARFPDLERPPAGSSVLFLRDPYPEDFTTFFMARLTWDDPTLSVHLASKFSEPPRPAAFDVLIDYAGGRFRRLPTPRAAPPPDPGAPPATPARRSP